MSASVADHAAVHSIDHFALNVPSLDEARRFYTTFGLDARDAANAGEAFELYAADGHRWARILQAGRKSLAYLSFGCFAADLERLHRQIASTGVEVSTDAEGLWFRDPDGNTVQVKPAPKTSPSGKTPSLLAGVPANARGSHARSESVPVRPRRLSHVLLFSADVLAALDFYERALGLRLSDRSRDIIAFTHAPHGSDHHLVAFAKSAARGWHHCAWDVDDINRVGEGAAQMAAAGYTKGWGTGRHVLGSNYFHYVEDPWGSFCEYSADIDYISAGEQWDAGDFPPEDSLYLWGPAVPENFVRNSECGEEKEPVRHSSSSPTP
ncbi:MULTISPECIES: VOC family protein [Paraburkholderia]|uniref:VOC family protein n=1 Tax=Paraburkholderia TaxID=1822464 RepID=UPI0022535CF4|nr:MULTISPECIES: VOC family protein [Paraburkholderia]MCX4162531.1 VOC family protein [Paraburkholderia megapolitana]MDN7158026.1 VOC family protein [Paraburkholderia sp. CHISQ3]MDQ6495073.1 VOC family protein [Paraburkholderia megapolitana]